MLPPCDGKTVAPSGICRWELTEDSHDIGLDISFRRRQDMEARRDIGGHSLEKAAVRSHDIGDDATRYECRGEHGPLESVAHRGVPVVEHLTGESFSTLPRATRVRDRTRRLGDGVEAVDRGAGELLRESSARIRDNVMVTASRCQQVIEASWQEPVSVGEENEVLPRAARTPRSQLSGMEYTRSSRRTRSLGSLLSRASGRSPLSATITSSSLPAAFNAVRIVRTAIAGRFLVGITILTRIAMRVRKLAQAAVGGS